MLDMIELPTRTDAEIKEQHADKNKYTIYQVFNKIRKAVAWNVPRIDRDIMLDSVFKPRLVRISDIDGEYEAIFNSYESEIVKG